MRYGGAIGLGILATGLLGMLSPQAAFALAQEISRSLDGRKIERDQLNQSHKNNQKILPQKITSQIEIKRTPGIKTQQRQLELLQLDLKKSRQRGDHKSEAETLNKISLVYTDLKKFKESLESSLQALNLYKQLKSQEGELNTIGNIIDVYFKLRKPQQSEQFIQEKIKEIRSSNDELSEKVFIGILRDRLKKDWRFSAGFGMVADGSLQREIGRAHV